MQGKYSEFSFAPTGPAETPAHVNKEHFYNPFFKEEEMWNK